MSNLVETCKKVGLFKTLMNAVDIAGFDNELQYTGPFTLLAPVDSAFKKLAPGLVDELMKNPEKLRRVVAEHIIPGASSSEEFEKCRGVRTAAGDELAVRLEYDGIRIGGARVVEADLIADNGIIHGIDKVIFPPAIL